MRNANSVKCAYMSKQFSNCVGTCQYICQIDSDVKRREGEQRGNEFQSRILLCCKMGQKQIHQGIGIYHVLQVVKYENFVYTFYNMYLDRNGTKNTNI